jgi:hypothetical protein
LIGLCEVLCVDLDDDSVVVFVSRRVADNVEKKIENAVSRNVLGFIIECVRGHFDGGVQNHAPKNRVAEADNGVVVIVLEPVVRQVIDATGGQLGPAPDPGREELGRLQVTDGQ